MQEQHSEVCCRLDFRVEQCQPQEVCAVALMIWRLDNKGVVVSSYVH